MAEKVKGPLLGQGRTAEVFGWGENQILKLYRQEFSPDMVELEARIGRSICEAGIATPAIEGLIEVEGRLGIIYQRVTGPSMLEVFSKKPWLLWRLARQFAQLQAQLHATEQPELPLQDEMLRRAIERPTVLSAQTKGKVLERLAQLSGSNNTTCHGDYHPGNILMSERGPVIIDWMTANQGNPLADVARSSYLLTQAALPPGTNSIMKLLIQVLRRLFHFFYLRSYGKLRPFSRQQLQEWRGVIAAARLNEEIVQEEARLIAIVEASLSSNKRRRFLW